MNPKIEPLEITFEELRENRFIIPDDKYGIVAYVLTSSRLKSLMECPFVEDPAACALYLILADGVVVGRETYFASKVKIGEEIVSTEAASAFEVKEEFRKYAIGADIVMATFRRSKFFIGANVSSMALPLDRKLKFHILEFPRLYSIRDLRYFLESRNLLFLKSIINIPLKLFNLLILIKARLKKKKYRIERVSIIPDWIDDIVLNDGHKYAEYHNHLWFQWNLDNCFKKHPLNTQAFYCIYRDEKPIGFFMIKERYRGTGNNRKEGLLIGSIVEWGTKDASVLNEYDINLLALNYFSRNIDIIETASVNRKTIVSLKRSGFLKEERGNIVFKDRTNKYKDASNIDLWRVRLGYGDSILS